MPRVTHVKSARKAQSHKGIEIGDSYYWWKFRFGPKRVSKTPPRASQLTQSDFLGQMYALQEQLEDLSNAGGDCPYEDVSAIADAARDLGAEQEEKLSNMPESLQYSPTGELLQERADAMETWASELEDLAERANEGDEDAQEELLSCEPQI